MGTKFGGATRIALALKGVALIVAALAILTLGGAGSQAEASDGTVTVVAGSNYFCDPTLGNDVDPGVYCETTIHVGDSIQWSNIEGFHDATECGASWSKWDGAGNCVGADWTTGFLPTGTVSAPQAFGIAGTYDYLCTIHGLSMKARVVVVEDAPPVVDVDGPATSGTAAVPNPTDGASTVTVTATVDDTATGGSNIAAAEYFVGVLGVEGAGTAMAASNGAFNEVSEGVTANVNASGLAVGAHSIFVRGQDAAGNWGAADSTTLTVSETPAGAETVSIEVLGGTLFVETTAVDMGVLTLTGHSQLIETAADHWHAGDATGTGNGWNLTIASSEFVSGANSIPVDGTDNFKVMIDHIMIEDGNAAPASTVATYQPMGAIPLTVLSAGVGEGMGEYHFEPELSLNVPAETYAGDYEALLTVSINSGP